VERTKVTVVVNDRSTESGQMQVRRDDKMRIELTSPDPRTILRDGDHLYIYTPKTSQVEEYDLSKHRDLVDQFLLLGFGTSGGKLEKELPDHRRGRGDDRHKKWCGWNSRPSPTTCASKYPRSTFGSTKRPLGFPRSKSSYETGTADYFIVRYTNVARNVSLPDSRFKPHWPAGATRVKPQGLRLFPRRLRFLAFVSRRSAFPRQ
jgi:hypothetical protein